MIIAMSAGDEMFIPRCLDLERLLARRSVFLFGPRQTGKSTYVLTGSSARALKRKGVNMLGGRGAATG